MFAPSTLAIFGVAIFLVTCLIVSAVGFLIWRQKARSFAVIVLTGLFVLAVVAALTIMTLTVTNAYAQYQLEGACIKQKIQAGVPRKNIYVANGKCMVIRNNDGG